MALLSAFMSCIGKILLGSILARLGCLAVFIITLGLTVQRINRDFDDEEARAQAELATIPPTKETVHGNAPNQS